MIFAKSSSLLVEVRLLPEGREGLSDARGLLRGAAAADDDDDDDAYADGYRESREGGVAFVARKMGQQCEYNASRLDRGQ